MLNDNNNMLTQRLQIQNVKSKKCFYCNRRRDFHVMWINDWIDNCKKCWRFLDKCQLVYRWFLLLPNRSGPRVLWTFSFPPKTRLHCRPGNHQVVPRRLIEDLSCYFRLIAVFIATYTRTRAHTHTPCHLHWLVRDLQIVPHMLAPAFEKLQTIW